MEVARSGARLVMPALHEEEASNPWQNDVAVVLMHLERLTLRQGSRRTPSPLSGKANNSRQLDVSATNEVALQRHEQRVRTLRTILHDRSPPSRGGHRSGRGARTGGLRVGAGSADD